MLAGIVSALVIASSGGVELDCSEIAGGWQCEVVEKRVAAQADSGSAGGSVSAPRPAALPAFDSSPVLEDAFRQDQQRREEELRQIEEEFARLARLALLRPDVEPYIVAYPIPEVKRFAESVGHIEVHVDLNIDGSGFCGRPHLPRTVLWEFGGQSGSLEYEYCAPQVLELPIADDSEHGPDRTIPFKAHFEGRPETEFAFEIVIVDDDPEPAPEEPATGPSGGGTAPPDAATVEPDGDGSVALDTATVDLLRESTSTVETKTGGAPASGTDADEDGAAEDGDGAGGGGTVEPDGDGSVALDTATVDLLQPSTSTVETKNGSALEAETVTTPSVLGWYILNGHSIRSGNATRGDGIQTEVAAEGEVVSFEVVVLTDEFRPGEWAEIHIGGTAEQGVDYEIVTAYPAEGVEVEEGVIKVPLFENGHHNWFPHNEFTIEQYEIAWTNIRLRLLEDSEAEGLESIKFTLDDAAIAPGTWYGKQYSSVTKFISDRLPSELRRNVRRGLYQYEFGESCRSPLPFVTGYDYCGNVAFQGLGSDLWNSGYHISGCTDEARQAVIRFTYYDSTAGSVFVRHDFGGEEVEEHWNFMPDPNATHNAIYEVPVELTCEDQRFGYSWRETQPGTLGGELGAHLLGPAAEATTAEATGPVPAVEMWKTPPMLESWVVPADFFKYGREVRAEGSEVLVTASMVLELDSLRPGEWAEIHIGGTAEQGVDYEVGLYSYRGEYEYLETHEVPVVIEDDVIRVPLFGDAWHWSARWSPAGPNYFSKARFNTLLILSVRIHEDDEPEGVETIEFTLSDAFGVLHEGSDRYPQEFIGSFGGWTLSTERSQTLLISDRLRDDDAPVEALGFFPDPVEGFSSFGPLTISRTNACVTPSGALEHCGRTELRKCYGESSGSRRAVLWFRHAGPPGDVSVRHDLGGEEVEETWTFTTDPIYPNLYSSYALPVEWNCEEQEFNYALSGPQMQWELQVTGR